MRYKLRRLDILAIVLGSIIGWGSFTLPGTAFLPKSGIISTAIGLFLGAIFIVFIEKAYYYMMSSEVKEDGGEFAYTYNNLGKTHGFIVGWGLTLCYLSIVPLNATAFVLVFKVVFKDALDFMYLYSIAGYRIYLSDILIAWAVLILFAYINIRGIKMSSIVQNTLALFLVTNVVIIFFVILSKADLNQFTLNYLTGPQISFTKIVSVLAMVPFLFVGFDIIVQMSTDLGFDSKKASPIAVTAVLCGALIYVMLNTITGLCYGPESAGKISWALGEGVLHHMHKTGFTLLIIALLAAVSGGINGFMLSSSKLLGALANYGMVPEKYGIKNEKAVNANAIKFVTMVSMIAPFFGREVIGYIVDLSSLFAAITYLYVCKISLKKAIGKDKILVFIGLLVSTGFVLLLVLPISPTFLSTPSIVFMVVWIILGTYYFYKFRNNLKSSIVDTNKNYPFSPSL